MVSPSFAAPAAAAASGWSRRQLAGLGAIMLAATLLRCWRLEQWSWHAAEAVTWRLLTEPLGALFGSSDGIAPLGVLALRAVHGSGLLPGFGEGWLRLPGAFVGALSVPLLALALRPRWGTPVALLAALLLALHPGHLLASQMMHVAGFGALAGLLAGAAWLAGHRRLAVGAAVVAGLTTPVGWSILLVAALAPAARRWPMAVLALFALALPTGLATMGLPLLAAAAVGLAVLADPVLRLAAVLPFAAAAVAAWVAPESAPATAAVALPGLAAAAAVGLHTLATTLGTGLRGTATTVALGAATPALLVVTWCAVDAFLYLTVYRGLRTPWRTAVDTVLAATEDARGVTVAAGAGQSVLTTYLRPNHWRGEVVDPHPGCAVVPLAAAFPDVNPAASPALVVLRRDELAALGAAQQERLARDFVLQRVVASPQPHGDDSVYVYRRADGR